MKLCRSKYQDNFVDVVEVNMLTPTALYFDDREYLVKESIYKNGLMHPLLVVTWNAQQWANHCKVTTSKIDGEIYSWREFPEIIPESDFLHHSCIWAVKIGNQRLAAIKQLNYTHVNVIFCETTDSALLLRNKLNTVC